VVLGEGLGCFDFLSKRVDPTICQSLYLLFAAED